MLSEKVTILASDDGGLTLQSHRQSSCQGCALSKGCGQYLLAGKSELFSLACGSYHTESAEISGQEPSMLPPGSEAELKVASTVLIPITLIFYILPLGFLMGGVGLGVLLALNEPALVTLSFIFLGFGLLLSRNKLSEYQKARIVSITPYKSATQRAESREACGAG